MECHTLTFYGKEIQYSTLLDYLKNVEKPFRVITNNLEVHNYLNIKKIQSINLAEVFPEEGNVAEEIHGEAKKILEQYKQFFKNITYNEINVFKGFEYLVLIQLSNIIKAKMLLKNSTNTVFVFERYSPVFFVIQKIAQELGYHSESKIGLIRNKKIEILKNIDENFEINAKIRTINFVKNSFGGNFSLKNLKTLIKYFVKFLSLKIKKSSNKTKNIDLTIKDTLKNIDKKIKNSNVNSILFLSASRLDIYLRPMQPVLKKFDSNKIQYHIITTDISTSMMLTKNNIFFISFFEEIDFLLNSLRKSDYGIKIKNELEKNMNEFNTIIGLKELFPDLLNKTYRSIAIIILLEHIFKKIKIKNIIDSGTGQILENLAIEIAEKNNIVSYCMIPSPPTPSPIFSDWIHAKKIFVEGEQGLEVLETLGYSKDKILTVGGPRYDKFKNLNLEEIKKEFSKKNGLDSTKKLIVIAMSRWHTNDEEWISELIYFCNEKNYEIVIKIHPTYKVASQNLSENIINNIKNKCKNLKFLISYEIDIPTLFLASNLIITDWSSVGLEAILLEKPLIQVNFTNEEIEQYVRYFDYNASILIKNIKELKIILDEILIKKIHSEKLKNGREDIIKKYNYLNDGKATERVFKILTNK